MRNPARRHLAGFCFLRKFFFFSRFRESGFYFTTFLITTRNLN
ncbi:hypothetical protein DDD_0467 [Nonlabens dokdonensis DSW-6]|uniref:Uncharacterized protein n=1 Tax=Nonlabens dokdonensis (strain DSM 17205 / KCTC 12402 / DSW-6) TaxID=592029 RepID=L7W645_NONDD|nr:hypothetical protein DDD_0467 [Nonlabens dokdonensis DSW-6]